MTFEIRKNDDDTLDEVWFKRAEFVHLEQMDDGHWWLRVDMADGQAVVVNLWTKRNARINVFAELD